MVDGINLTVDIYETNEFTEKRDLYTSLGEEKYTPKA